MVQELGEKNKQPQPQPQPQSPSPPSSLTPPPSPPGSPPPIPPPPPPPDDPVVPCSDELTLNPSASNTTTLKEALSKFLIDGEACTSQQILDMYVMDYLKKKGLNTIAESFQKEANVTTDPIKIDIPDGFLNLWWSGTFHDKSDPLDKIWAGTFHGTYDPSDKLKVKKK